MPDAALLIFRLEGPAADRRLTITPVAAVSEPEAVLGLAKPIWEGPVGGEQDVQDLLDGFRDSLEEIHRLAGTALNLSPANSSRTVDRLLLLANDVGYALFRGLPGGLYNEARRLFPNALDPGEPPRIVEVIGPKEFTFPFELLQWQDVTAHDSAPDGRIRALLGMSAIVAQRFEGIDHGAGWGRLRNMEGLPISVFRHRGLEASAQEIAYLKEEIAPHLVHVYGPWPGDELLAPQAAVRHLLDTNMGIDGVERGRLAEVVHLACHCLTLGVPSKHYINIGGGEHGRVTIQDLTRGVMQRLGLNAPTPRPLIFINACASADPKMNHRSSFARFFLEQGAYGVLGTLCDISDKVASHFARVFYQHLLEGCTIGEAMYEARSHLMQVHGNPLGLLYTFFGNPDLKLARPHPGELAVACTQLERV